MPEEHQIRYDEESSMFQVDEHMAAYEVIKRLEAKYSKKIDSAGGYDAVLKQFEGYLWGQLDEPDKDRKYKGNQYDDEKFHIRAALRLLLDPAEGSKFSNPIVGGESESYPIRSGEVMHFRKMIALFWLAATDTEFEIPSSALDFYKDSDDSREQVFESMKLHFILTMSEIRRAHNEGGNYHTSDSPIDEMSCVPGIYGRILKSVIHNPDAQMRSSIKKDIEPMAIKFILDKFRSLLLDKKLEYSDAFISYIISGEIKDGVEEYRKFIESLYSGESLKEFVDQNKQSLKELGHDIDGFNIESVAVAVIKPLSKNLLLTEKATPNQNISTGILNISNSLDTVRKIAEEYQGKARVIIEQMNEVIAYINNFNSEKWDDMDIDGLKAKMMDYDGMIDRFRGLSKQLYVLADIHIKEIKNIETYSDLDDDKIKKILHTSSLINAINETTKKYKKSITANEEIIIRLKEITLNKIIEKSEARIELAAKTEEIKSYLQEKIKILKSEDHDKKEETCKQKLEIHRYILILNNELDQLIEGKTNDIHKQVTSFFGEPIISQDEIKTELQSDTDNIRQLIKMLDDLLNSEEKNIADRDKQKEQRAEEEKQKSEETKENVDSFINLLQTAIQNYKERHDKKYCFRAKLSFRLKPSIPQAILNLENAVKKCKELEKADAKLQVDLCKKIYGNQYADAEELLSDTQSIDVAYNILLGCNIKSTLRPT